MFATLLGGLPRPPLPDDARSGDLVAAAIGAQEAAGLEPLVDGGLWGSDELGTVVERWRATAALTDRAVKAVVRGPWSATGALAGSVEEDALAHDLADGRGRHEYGSSRTRRGGLPARRGPRTRRDVPRPDPLMRAPVRRGAGAGA